MGQLHFNPKSDTLWLTGDLVNRGPDSLGVLRYLYTIRDSLRIVLGNHDIYLLAAANGIVDSSDNSALQAVVTAPDCAELLQWLVTCPLLYREHNYTLVHAGIPPQWSIADAQIYADQAGQRLRHPPHCRQLLHRLYSDTSQRISESVVDQCRTTIRSLTQIRFCNAAGSCDFTVTDSTHPNITMRPWFAHPHRRTRDDIIIFGHWAALRGKCDTPHVYALDGGCVWGGALVALCLDNMEKTHCVCA